MYRTALSDSFFFRELYLDTLVANFQSVSLIIADWDDVKNDVAAQRAGLKSM
jgi:hypothetical protein